MTFKDRFGLDPFDIAIQASITGVCMFAIAATNSARDAFVGIPVLTVASLVLLDVRRKLGLRRARRRGLSEPSVPEALAEVEQRVAELEERLAEAEAQQRHVAELEDRLDFAERLLAQRREQELLPREGGQR